MVAHILIPVRLSCTYLLNPSRDIKCLIDVRRNAFSRKFGFSKSILKTAVESVGVEYVHIPQLGIDSTSRKKVGIEHDFKGLMAEYGSSLRSEQGANFRLISNLLSRYRRIALTCFEANSVDCHRRPLSGCVKELLSPSVVVEHI